MLSGARKQLFITFAPWVLVSVLEQPTQIMATLFTIGGVIGILFQPLLGWAIDKLGERTVLASEAVILVFVCFGYGFAKFLFPADTAFLVVCACFLIDQMIFSVSMARATYMKKIAIQPDHIQPALTAAVTIDHVFSITAALVGGVIWNVVRLPVCFPARHGDCGHQLLHRAAGAPAAEKYNLSWNWTNTGRLIDKSHMP